ncbi:hypothetical protein Taro_051215 [Colocasia esculenta]|uniref:Thioredoxin domain-containing protein n=1 Tax=Colocasia esculenta TaxID=4460 RepID=A0A843XGG1_COLES|nr:hypothetical protein [Colocasia esculenta]
MGGSGGAVKEVKSKQELDDLLRGGSPAILQFWATWCEASKQMDQLFSHLSTDFPHALFLRVEAEDQPEISEAFSVSAVPYFVFFKVDVLLAGSITSTSPTKPKMTTTTLPTCPNLWSATGGRKDGQEEVLGPRFKDSKVVDKLEGANPPSLANKVAKIAGSVNAAESAAPASLGMAAGPAVLETVKELSKENGASVAGNSVSGVSDSLNSRLQQLVNSHPVFLFMKGTPDQPRCGFSQKVVDILKDEGVEFGSFDILSDNEVREGMKKFSNWPTFPQLFCKGELLGGCDIAIAMHESGELKEVFRDHGVLALSGAPNSESEKKSEKSVGVTDPTGLSSALTSRLEALINANPVMLFMKGTPEQPRCGFSRKAVEIVQQEKVKFEAFDILSDEEVRQGLKVFSNWSSYPQLYIKGELIGGSDIMLEMQKSGELKRTLTEKGVVPEETLEDRLRNLISSTPVMLFMKGTPDAPRCGFSSKVVDALRQEDVAFGSFDILADDEVRQGLKTFSNWPTFPQLYYKSELIGGCDIVLELHKNGELKATLSE